MNLNQLAEFINAVEIISDWNASAFSKIKQGLVDPLLVNLCDIGEAQNEVLLKACKALTEVKKDEIIN